MTAEQKIDYEALARDAMRGIVRAALMQTARAGLPGDHHFYISFDTRAPGIAMSRRLKEKYPYEMTIVLQHRFWDLIVTDERFEVKLTFDGIPERLVIPFAAIKVFFDPSVRYGLQFEEAADAAPDAGEQQLAARALVGDPVAEGAPGSRGGSPRQGAARKPRAPRKPRSDKEGPAAEMPPKTATAASEPDRAGAASKVQAPKAPAPESGSTEPAAEPAESGAKVVRLDTFRKK